MNNYLTIILNLVKTIISIVGEYIMNIKLSINIIFYKTVNNQTENNYYNTELSSEEIKNMMNTRIKEALKDRPRIYTCKDSDIMLNQCANIKNGDIVFTYEDV